MGLNVFFPRFPCFGSREHWKNSEEHNKAMIFNLSPGAGVAPGDRLVLMVFFCFFVQCFRVSEAANIDTKNNQNQKP